MMIGPAPMIRIVSISVLLGIRILRKRRGSYTTAAGRQRGFHKNTCGIVPNGTGGSAILRDWQLVSSHARGDGPCSMLTHMDTPVRRPWLSLGTKGRKGILRNRALEQRCRRFQVITSGAKRLS